MSIEKTKNLLGKIVSEEESNILFGTTNDFDSYKMARVSLPLLGNLFLIELFKGEKEWK